MGALRGGVESRMMQVCVGGKEASAPSSRVNGTTSSLADESSERYCARGCRLAVWLYIQNRKGPARRGRESDDSGARKQRAHRSRLFSVKCPPGARKEARTK